MAHTALLEIPLNPGFPVTVLQAILNCKKLGRPHRRKLARRLEYGKNFKRYREIEQAVCKNVK